MKATGGHVKRIGGHYPRRGDDVEAWILDWRDRWNRAGERPEFQAIDGMLDEYREKADHGLAIDEDGGDP